MIRIPDPVAAIIVLSCWVVFLLVWAITALFTKRTTYKQSRAESLAYRIPAALAAFLLLGRNRGPFPLNVALLHNTDLTRLAAIVLAAGGLAFCLWARMTLGRNWSSAVVVKEGHELIQRGPYRIVRHPIYTGILVMFSGIVVINGTVGALLGVALLFTSFWIKARYEEKIMLQQFPGEYPAYMERVKGIIPFVI